MWFSPPSFRSALFVVRRCYISNTDSFLFFSPLIACCRAHPASACVLGQVLEFQLHSHNFKVYGSKRAPVTQDVHSVVFLRGGGGCLHWARLVCPRSHRQVCPLSRPTIGAGNNRRNVKNAQKGAFQIEGSLLKLSFTFTSGFYLCSRSSTVSALPQFPFFFSPVITD